MWCEIDNVEFYYLYYTLGHFAIFNYHPYFLVIGKYLVFMKLTKQYETDKITYYSVDTSTAFFGCVK